jgi:hypothetical protein
MKNTLSFLFFTVVIFLWACKQPASSVTWPEITTEARPWSRWWWHGSSVSKEGITAEMEAYRNAGLGGLELTPIYGVIGDEDHFLNFLSPEWMDMLEYTLKEGARLGLGIDMANGTGWPFGGPWVGVDNACRYVAHQSYSLSGGEGLTALIRYDQEPVVRAVSNPVVQSVRKAELPPGERSVSVHDLVRPVEANADLQALALDQVRFNEPLPLVTLMAYSDRGEILDLTGKVTAGGRLDWTAPEGNWTLDALFAGWHGKMVERAAPGGEGNVIDHFSATAIRHYLTRFDSAFAGRNLGYLRAFFNDSYEVDDAFGQANWTPDFLDEFVKRRGYDLRAYLPALCRPDTSEQSLRVLSDFRETFSDLILDTFTREWGKWAHSKGKFIRNQSHGAPANILDLYAASDIPETEGTETLRIKFASSAAHVTGKRLVSAEAATWLNEHFRSDLADIKQNLDNYFTGGVNHIFYHGTCYSPPEESWPGRLFYAAIHANPRNTLWHDWPALNQYISRVQSFLQAGRPDNDVLLYFPMYDRFATPGRELLEHFDGYGPSLEGTPLEKIALFLHETGYPFDFVSDRQIGQISVDGSSLVTGGARYQTLLVPPCRFMPLKTIEKLEELARAGATILFHDQLPDDVPGLSDLENRQKVLKALIERHQFISQDGIDRALSGKGSWIKGSDLAKLLAVAGVKPEKMTGLGLEFTRRSLDQETVYFITNWSGSVVDQWVPLGKAVNQIILFQPWTGKSGIARIRVNGEGTAEIYLQLERGEGVILQTLSHRTDRPEWSYYETNSSPQVFTGTWAIQFTQGGPLLPDPVTIDSLRSWSGMNGEGYRAFSGTAVYTISFDRPLDASDAYLLDLGKIHESARVRLNGADLGVLIGPVFRTVVAGDLLQENNTLEVEVTNLMANRIANLDRNGVLWKKFYNINFPSRLRENRGADGLFDASEWEPLPSGLLGPVTITSLSRWH